MDIRICLLLAAEAGLALVLLWSAGVLRKPAHVLCAVLLLAAAFVLLFAGTYILQLSTQIAYTLTDTDPVAEVFPPDNPIVVLYNNADEDAVAALADRLEADPNVKSAMAYSTTLGRQYTACLLYTSPSPRDVEESRMPSSA